MNSFVVVALFACLAACNAGLLVDPSAKVLQGPSSKTTLVGPEGSVISAHAPGGQIIHEEHPGVVTHVAPVLAHAAPVLAQAAHGVHSTVVAHSSAYEQDSVLVAGPSGSISTGPYAASAVAHAAPVVAHAAPVVAYATPVIAHANIYDHGHEGQFVHDYSESLYDDGSYKPHAYHH